MLDSDRRSVGAVLTTPSLLKRLLSSRGSSAGMSLLSLLLSTLLLASLLPEPAHAIPVFARQVQQNCVACHVGGQYPELTPYGRYFKLTGYTQGVAQITPDGVGIPLAFSVQAGVNKMDSNRDINGVGIDPRNGRFAPDQASVYSGGRIADNVGAFVQYTAAWDQGNSHDVSFGSDNFDLRYADHLWFGSTDLIYGASLNNDPGVTDVFNSTPAWSFPWQYSASGSATAPPVQTFLEGGYGGGTARGFNGYLYLGKSFYAEYGSYSAATGPFRVLTFTASAAGGSNNGTVPLAGGNPYYRLAYTTEWGPSNLMVGAFGMNSKVGDGLGLNDGLETVYRDRGLDAQYQYISDPHVVSTQLRYISEKITDDAGLYSGPANLKSRYAKAMYVYRAKYGTALGYWSENGSPDPTAYVSTGASSANLNSINNSPNSTAWIPAVFWQPLQNVRVTLYRTYWTKFLGAKDNYDGLGRNAKDNNSTYLYLWIDF